jgi:hypothetical protein
VKHPSLSSAMGAVPVGTAPVPSKQAAVPWKMASVPVKLAGVPGTGLCSASTSAIFNGTTAYFNDTDRDPGGPATCSAGRSACFTGMAACSDEQTASISAKPALSISQTRSPTAETQRCRENGSFPRRFCASTSATAAFFTPTKASAPLRKPHILVLFCALVSVGYMTEKKELVDVAKFPLPEELEWWIFKKRSQQNRKRRLFGQKSLPHWQADALTLGSRP